MGALPADDSTPSAPALALWLLPEQAPLARAVAAEAGVRIAAAGSPVRGQSGAVATDLGCATLDDLRGALTGAAPGAAGECDAVLILAPGDFGRAADADVRDLEAARERGRTVLTTEPVPASALDVAAPAWRREGLDIRPEELCRPAAMLRHTRPWRDATDAIATFGPVRAVVVECFGSPADCTLGAHLFSALDVVQSVLGEAETIHASFVPPGFVAGVHSSPGDTLRDLRGDATANLRFPDGRCAAIVASDHAGRFNRCATLLGPAGRLRVYDDGFEWSGPSGEKTDELRLRRERAGEPTPSAAPRSLFDSAPPTLPTPHNVLQLADAVRRALDPGLRDAPVDFGTVLTMAGALLLSAKTGEKESPATIRRMAAG
jgi:hypothetical protein